ncbi:Nn.00g072390.m01.CDS01 [Neocucurbitaria sp. VM-36]
MVEPGKLEFNKIGMLNSEEDIDDPVVGHSWCKHDGIMLKVEAKFSSRELFFGELEDKLPANINLADLANNDDSDEDKEEKEKQLHHYRGMLKIMYIIFACEAFTSKKQPTDEHETFVLRHPDLDLQNILVDDEGNVTGILDWHEATTAPRCIGFSALPYFLTHDWHPDFTLSDPPYMVWTVNHYRRIYVDAMKDACADGRYTYKSAIYQAAYAVVTRGGSYPDLVLKVLLQLPGLRLTDLEEFQERLG